MLKVISGLILSVGLVLSTSGAALATTPALPATTSWTNAGLQEMVRFAGPISVSIDGAGFATTGTLQVDKPANSTVIAAYLTSAVTSASTSAPGVTLNGTTVTFSHMAIGTGVSSFVNHFADVTTIVKNTIDAAPSGVVNIAVEEGAATSANEGQSLIVVFDDPAKPASSVIIMFGASKTAGDSFSFSFPAITDLNAQIPTLSLGIGFSFQSSNNRTQQSDVKISTSSNTSLQTISLTAGGFDDGAGANGALLTVGGVGDSPDLPGLTATSDDDELYGLGSFLSLGDTTLSVNTRNASGDDNLFLSVLYFQGVSVAGAVTVGSAPLVFVGSPPVVSPPAPVAPPVTVTPTEVVPPPAAAPTAVTPVSVATPTLATTGPSEITTEILWFLSFALVAFGVWLLGVRRRLRT